MRCVSPCCGPVVRWNYNTWSNVVDCEVCGALLGTCGWMELQYIE